MTTRNREGEGARVAVLTLLVALAWLVVPGLAVGGALRLRGWTLVGAAPPLALGALAVASQVVPLVGLRWSPSTAGLAVLVLAGGLAALARPWAFRPSAREWWAPRWSRGQHLGIAVALTLAGVLGIVAVWSATRGLDAVNQTWDAFHHGGAVRLIAETGDPRPGSVGAIAAPASTDYFSPALYHAVGALVYLANPAVTVPQVLNSIAALLPLFLAAGLAGLMRVATGRPAHALAAAALAASAAAAPYEMTGYGALLPYGLALAMVPGALLLVQSLLGTPRWTTGMALGLVAGGLLNTHPQVAVLVALVAVLQLVRQLVHPREIRRALWPGLGAAVLLAVVTSVAVLGSLVGTAGEADGIDWPAYTTPGGAVRDLLLFGSASAPQVVFLPLLAAGVVALLRSGRGAPLRPLLVALPVIGWLYVLAGASDTPFSLAMTALWWNDRHRLGAAFVVLALPVCAAGLVALRDWLWAAGRRAPLPSPARTGVLAALLVLFVATTGGGYLAETRDTVAMAYDPAGPTLSDAERDGLAAAAAVIREDGGGAVMNDPHDGCGWAWALDGVDVLFPTPLTGPFDWANLGFDRERLFFDFAALDADPAVLADARGLDVRWALLCAGFVGGRDRAPGLAGLPTAPGATLVYADSAVQLYRISDGVPPSDAG